VEGRLEKFKAVDTIESIVEEEITKEEKKEEKKKSNQTWVRLIQKVFEVDPMICPKCGSEMKIIAVITEPLAVDCILRYLEKKGLPPFNLPKAHSPPGKQALSA
jgi:hypothetical protein